MAKKGLKIKEVTASKPEKEYCGPPPTQNDRVSSVILANINRIRQLLTWEKRLVKTNVKQTNIKRQMLSDFQIRDVRMNDSLEILRMRYERERLIRKQAEQIAEDKSSAPFVKSRELAELNQLKNKFGNCRARPATPPLGSIKGYLGLFLGGYLGLVSDSQRTIMLKMSKACEAMLALINELLDASAIEAGRLNLTLQKVDLATYLREWHESNILLGKAKSITLDLEPSLPRVKMDVNRVVQALNNLITNAIKVFSSR